MSLFTFFSRARASTSISKSRLIPSPPAIQFRSRTSAPGAPCRSCSSAKLPIFAHSTLSTTLSPFRPTIMADEIALVAHGHAQLQLRVLTGETQPVGGLLQRTIQSGRRNLQPVVVDVLDGEQAGQMVADSAQSSIVSRSCRCSVRLVDEHAQQAALADSSRNQRVRTRARSPPVQSIQPVASARTSAALPPPQIKNGQTAHFLPIRPRIENGATEKPRRL